ncbi:uncharacterized protein LOC133815051 [Humulus lupulus]|uniref:uncharacterized protein LOC133815051 n=1 Tax=Humulus lupulus TaxID=3486 RepID=UPI002B411400|nr:uncharacterized protein LOC133815051 [Humulus lupulus]
MGESKCLCPETVRETNEAIAKIRAHMIASQDRQKSYVDPKHKHVDFQVGNHVFLRVSPIKVIKKFGKKGKLSPRFVGPFETIEDRGKPSHILSYEALDMQPDLSYEEKLVKILEKKEKALRNKMIGLVKVLWKNDSTEDATWELETDMSEQYPELLK